MNELYILNMETVKVLVEHFGHREACVIVSMVLLQEAINDGV
jgi:hypothetical protein